MSKFVLGWQAGDGYPLPCALDSATDIGSGNPSPCFQTVDIPGVNSSISGSPIHHKGSIKGGHFQGLGSLTLVIGWGYVSGQQRAKVPIQSAGTVSHSELVGLVQLCVKDYGGGTRGCDTTGGIIVACSNEIPVAYWQALLTGGMGDSTNMPNFLVRSLVPLDALVVSAM